VSDRRALTVKLFFNFRKGATLLKVFSEKPKFSICAIYIGIEEKIAINRKFQKNLQLPVF
jgi:hypothetical protein